MHFSLDFIIMDLSIGNTTHPIYLKPLNSYCVFQESLQEINLEGNKISKIAAGTFSDLSSLRSVNLRNNLLRTVSRISLQIVGRGEL